MSELVTREEFEAYRTQVEDTIESYQETLERHREVTSAARDKAARFKRFLVAAYVRISELEASR